MTDVNFHTVAKVGAIAEGEGQTFTLEGRMIAVFNDQGSYLAIDDLCPHMGASLAAGYVEDGTVACPWHAWRFKLSDGTWCDNPKVKIDSFPVRVVDDEIQVGIVAEQPAVDDETDQQPGKEDSSD